MSKQNDFRSFCAEKLDCRQTLPHPGVVRDPDLSIDLLGRHIEVDAHEDAPSVHFQVAYR